MSVTFNMIETDWTKEFYTTYEKVKEDIKQGFQFKEIREKHNISSGQWIAYRKELIQDGLLQGRYNVNPPKYYVYVAGRGYMVQKWIKNSRIYYGTFKTEREAQRCVELMKECGWDKEKRWEIRAKVKKEFQE